MLGPLLQLDHVGPPFVSQVCLVISHISWLYLSHETTMKSHVVTGYPIKFMVNPMVNHLVIPILNPIYIYTIPIRIPMKSHHVRNPCV